MIVHIIREACCSQDDQLGPLEIQEEIIFHIQKDNLVKNLMAESGFSFSFINSIFDIKDKTMTENKPNKCLEERSLLQNLIFWK